MTHTNIPNEAGRAPDDRDDNERAALEHALHEAEDRRLILRNVIVAADAMPDTPNWRMRVGPLECRQSDDAPAPSPADSAAIVAWETLTPRPQEGPGLPGSPRRSAHRAPPRNGTIGRDVLARRAHAEHARMAVRRTYRWRLLRRWRRRQTHEDMPPLVTPGMFRSWGRLCAWFAWLVIAGLVGGRLLALVAQVVIWIGTGQWVPIAYPLVTF